MEQVQSAQEAKVTVKRAVAVEAKISEEQAALIRARRTAFIARFIVLREGKRTRAHRVIEMLEWEDLTTVEELSEVIRGVFVENKDNMTPVERDLRRAVAHSSRSLNHFVQEYAQRATSNFVEALFDYDRSNVLLFGGEDQPKPGGWRLPAELKKSTDPRISVRTRARVAGKE